MGSKTHFRRQAFLAGIREYLPMDASIRETDAKGNPGASVHSGELAENTFYVFDAEAMCAVGHAIEDLLDQIVKHLPDGEPIFTDDEMTDQPVRSIVAEMVREKILMSTGEEIPYVTAVVTEVFDETDPKLTTIFCAIYVERASQKKIIIGKQGARIKDIGTKARLDIEKLLGKHVFLKLFVKVVADSTTDPVHQNVNGWGLKAADYFIPYNVVALDPTINGGENAFFGDLRRKR